MTTTTLRMVATFLLLAGLASLTNALPVWPRDQAPAPGAYGMPIPPADIPPMGLGAADGEQMGDEALSEYDEASGVEDLRSADLWDEWADPDSSSEAVELDSVEACEPAAACDAD